MPQLSRRSRMMLAICVGRMALLIRQARDWISAIEDV